jgi:hypothetical protein
MYQIATKEPDLAGVPSEVSELVRSCLAKDPAGRPTPAEIVERLAGEPVVTATRIITEAGLPRATAVLAAPTQGSTHDMPDPLISDGDRRGVRRRRRRGIVLGGFLTTVVIVVGGVAAYLHFRSDAPSPGDLLQTIDVAKYFDVPTDKVQTFDNNKNLFTDSVFNNSMEDGKQSDQYEWGQSFDGTNHTPDGAWRIIMTTWDYSSVDEPSWNSAKTIEADQAFARTTYHQLPAPAGMTAKATPPIAVPYCRSAQALEITDGSLRVRVEVCIATDRVPNMPVNGVDDLARLILARLPSPARKQG